MKTVMRKRAILLFMLIILSTSVYSLSITPAITQLKFEPGKEHSITYRVGGTSKEIQGNFPETFQDHITTSKVEKGQFTVTIKFPNTPEELNLKPGNNRINIGVKEKSSSEGVVVTLLALNAVIIVDVPYPGSYALMDIQAQDTKQGKPLNFKITVTNKGKQTIQNAQATIDVYKQDEKLTSLSTNKESIEQGKSKTLTSTLDTTDYSAGNYIINVTLLYDQKILSKLTEFKIGTLDLTILDYTKNFLNNSVSKFELNLESKWNDPIKDVYAEIKIQQNNKQVALLTTPTTHFNPWDTKTLSTYWDTKALNIGKYNATITIHFSDKTKQIQDIFEIIIQKKQIPFSIPITPTNILITTVSLLVIVNIVLITKFKKRKK